MSKNVVKITGKVIATEWVEKNGLPKLGAFSTEKDMQKFYKQLPIETLEKWASELKAEYKPCETSEPIHRMRVCMAILYSFFPKESTAKPKQESVYKKYSTEELVTMCIEKEVPVETTDDMRIMRMRCIMSLRAAKVIE